jgi:hypothetical protein
MAIYKTISSKVIIRKIFRDINPNTDNWIDDAIEWMGEALEHIGAAPQLELKNCVLRTKDYKAALPNDLFYINQVAINDSIEAAGATGQLNKLIELAEAIIGGGVSSYTLNEINVRIHVLENQILQAPGAIILNKCRGHFPHNADCPDCIEDNRVPFRCYYTEADKIKTSFAEGAICLSYMAFPLDDECYPMVPDDISFKEAMFWYVYKKMLLGNMNPSVNGVTYEFAEMQWMKYCTQARNAANYPDIDGYEAFLDQWVRLIPNINRHSTGFADLNLRESLDRKGYGYFTEVMPSSGGGAGATSTSGTDAGGTGGGGAGGGTGGGGTGGSTSTTSSVFWNTTTTPGIFVPAGIVSPIRVPNPDISDVTVVGNVLFNIGPTEWTLTNLLPSMTLTYSYTLQFDDQGAGDLDIEVVMVNTGTGQETIVGTTTYQLNGGTTQIQGDESNLVGAIQEAMVFLRIPNQPNPALISLRLTNGLIRLTTP